MAEPLDDLPGYLTVSAFEAVFIGGPVWRLTDPARAQEAAARARAAGVRLMSCRTGMQADLRSAGFRQVETLVTLTMPVADWRQGPAAPTGLAVRDARPSDIDACREIARTAFAASRFAADPAVSDRAAGDIKARWIENAIAGRADRVVVAERDGRIVGFNAVFLGVDGIVIDLIGIAEGERGQGVGRLLVDTVLSDYRGNASLVRVGTQAANGASLAFYKALGFKLEKEEKTWHWGPGDTG